MSRGAACGPPFGMGWDVESSGAGDGFPPVFRFLLGFRWVTGQSRARIVQAFTFGQGVRVTFVGRGHRPIPFLRPFDFAQGERNSPPGVWVPAYTGKTEEGAEVRAVRESPLRGRGVPARRGGAPSGGMVSCLRRKDGWGVAVWGGPRSTLRLRSGRTEFPASGDGGFLGTRRICGGGPPPARPFDGAQGERPLGPREGNHGEPVSKVAPRPTSRFSTTWIRAYVTRCIGQEYPIGLCFMDL